MCGRSRSKGVGPSHNTEPNGATSRTARSPTSGVRLIAAELIRGAWRAVSPEELVNKPLIYLTVAMLSSTAAPASHEIPVPQRTLGARPPTPPCGPGLDIKNAARDSRCFELRTYTVVRGSSADVLHTRFRERTIALFRKHGMTVIGFWQPVARLDQLVYILAYRDAPARDSAWAAFNADPEWVKTRTEMQVSVDVDNSFMVATAYSPLK